MLSWAGGRFVILWESSDHVHVTEQEARDIWRHQRDGMEEQIQGKARAMEREGEHLASVR